MSIPAQSPAMRARARRSLIQLGGLLALTLIVIGVFALFCVWSLNRTHVANQRRATEVLLALDDGRSVQAIFKIQVQEWKNVLLRGDSAAAFKTHFASFEEYERSVQARLNSLATRAERIGSDALAAKV